MIRLITIILLSLVCYVGIAQPVSQRSNGSSTVNDPRQIHTLNLFIPRFLDTTSANLSKGIDSCGAIIFTYTGNHIWKRDCSPKKWSLVDGGVSSDSNQILYYLAPLYAFNDTTLAIDTGAGRPAGAWVSTRHYTDSIGGKFGLIDINMGENRSANFHNTYSMTLDSLASLSFNRSGVQRIGFTSTATTLTNSTGTGSLSLSVTTGALATQSFLSVQSATLTVVSTLSTSIASANAFINLNNDSIYIQPPLGMLNVDSLRSGFIDTTNYKPLARKTSGDIVQMNSWAQVSGGGSGLFPLTGTGTATGNVTGALGANDFTVSVGGVGARFYLGGTQTFIWTPDTDGGLTVNGGSDVVSLFMGDNSIQLVPDSINISPYRGQINIDSLRSGFIDTTNYKPLARKGSGDIVQMNSWAQVSGGGSIPTFQQVLTAGSTTTGNNTVLTGAFDFTFFGDNSAGTVFSVADIEEVSLAGNLRLPDISSNTVIDTLTSLPLVVNTSSGIVEQFSSWAKMFSYVGSGSGVTTMAAIGSTPNANGATITGTILNLEPANGSFGGVVIAGPQTFEGSKRLNDGAKIGDNATDYGNIEYDGGAGDLIISNTYAASVGDIIFKTNNGTVTALIITGAGVVKPLSLAITSNIGTASLNFINTSSSTGYLDYSGTDFQFYTDNVLRATMNDVGFGIGITPSAYLQLKASTTAASTGQIKLAEGSRQTTPEDGTINYVANNLEFVETSTVYTLAKTLTATATLDFGSTVAGTSTDLTITVTGAVDGDAISVGVPNGSTLSNGVFTGWVSASNTVTIRFSNNSLAATLDPASGSFRVSVIRY